MEEVDAVLSQIALLAHDMQYDLDTALLPTKLNASNYYFILKLAKSDQLSQDEIFRSIHLNPSNVTRRLTQLIKLGYVERQKDENDKRAWNVRLTENGRAVVPQVRELVDKVQQQWLNKLSAAESNQLVELLDKLDNSQEA